MKREQLLCFAAVTTLAALSQARADDYSIPNTDRFDRPAEVALPMTCAQATALAWFKHQMELSDGGNEPVIATPVECERTLVVKTDVDHGAIEESK